MKRHNVHHLVYPRRDYVTALERQFRQLPCLKVALDVEVHALLHRLYGVPAHPSVNDMEWLVMRHDNQLCGCFAEGTQVNILAIKAGDSHDHDLPEVQESD